MKNSILALILFATGLCPMIQPRPAQAAVALSLGAAAHPVLIGLGALGVVGGLGSLGWAISEDPTAASKDREGVFAVTMVTLVGVILMDRDGVDQLSFTRLELGEAAAVGLTEAERAAFNGSLDEVNAILDEVQAGMRSRDSREPALASALWSEYSRSLDGSAARAAEKLAAHLARRVQSGALAR